MSSIPPAARSSSSSSLVAREWRALGRRLHLDQAPVAAMTTLTSTSADESSS
jgi:hypothetical protein